METNITKVLSTLAREMKSYGFPASVRTHDDSLFVTISIAKDDGRHDFVFRKDGTYDGHGCAPSDERQGGDGG